MTSKFIEKFHSLRDEHHFNDDVDIDIQFEYKYIKYFNTQKYILSVAKFKKKEAEFPKYVESLIKIFEINKLLVDLWNYEPDIYYIIAKIVLGVEEVTPFTNASFKNAIRDMTYEDTIKKHGDPKFWDITEVTDYNSVSFSQKYKFSSQFWNLHPTVKRSDLIFQMPEKKYHTNPSLCHRYYVRIDLPSTDQHYYYNNKHSRRHGSYCNHNMPIIGKEYINFETEEEKKERTKVNYKEYINFETEEEKKERTKVNYKAHRKEHQKIIKRYNRMTYKNNKCKSHYR